MGRVSYLYESIKDQLRWHRLSLKKYTRIISQVGQIMALGEEDYKKEKVKATKMSSSSLVDVLVSAFGDGK